MASVSTATPARFVYQTPLKDPELLAQGAVPRRTTRVFPLSGDTTDKRPGLQGQENRALALYLLSSYVLVERGLRTVGSVLKRIFADRQLLRLFSQASTASL